MDKLPCCGELAVFGHAMKCPNHPKPPPAPAKRERTAKLYTGPDACIYCAGKVGRGGITISRTDGGDDHAHKKCHAEACKL